MSPVRLFVLLPLMLTWLVGCHSAQPAEASATGSVRLAASTRQALSANAISRVTVTSSAADMPSITVELAQTDGVWGGMIGNIPAGLERIFQAQAFDAGGALLYEGQAEHVTVVAGQVTLVTLTLQDVSAPEPYENEAPLIDSVVAAPLVVAPGGTVTLAGSAHDLNPGDTLAYAWTASAGSFAAPSDASTTWSAPADNGPVTLALTVSDARGAASSVSLVVNVSAGEGGAVLDVRFNSRPAVMGFTSSESQLEVGESTLLTVSAADLDGDALSYQWSASCAGSLQELGLGVASFTPSALPAAACNNCQLSVSVSDGRGGQTSATLALCVTEPTVHALPPRVIRSYQSSLTARANQQLIFEVVASDPQGSALSFQWGAASGVFGASTDSATSSRVAWTAPACINDSSQGSLSVTLTNAANLTAVQTFSVTGLPTCTSNGSWVPVGAMVEPRLGHQAEVLPSGKVLVMGGNGPGGDKATAEIYDPVSQTWAATGSMSQTRSYFSAVSLPSGQVLVSGGEQGWNSYDTAELYDPSTGSWSPTPRMNVPRKGHTLTVLPSGKVLAAGGTTATAELYDPASGTWTLTGSMSMSRYGHTAVLLSSGKVLVMGGWSATAELYNPETGTWTATGSLNIPRNPGHTATLLPSGKVLVASGNADGGTVAELYDPATGTWTAAGSALNAHAGATATLLPSGKVLVVGGNLDNSAAAVLYDVASGTWAPVASMGPAQYRHTATLLSSGKVLFTSRSTVLYQP
ncbi:Kelch repeat-containing protein [Hyalangium minutum]|uniref:High-affinity leucine-specific transport system, periplasmic binding protein LivK n=1 Tax=Hyalangium minutum TaxID=394096 RepID=A0A085WUA3_9BACT|nr:kelch-like protein [Hyalangium minutum]KFE71266.1 High-affinity leucine-specific transport system, periplasmic binding protein LivK [Hyalangium minutum]